MVDLQCQSGVVGSGMVIDMPCCDVSHSVKVVDLQYVVEVVW